MGSSWRHIGSALTFRGRLMWVDGCVRERELAAHPPGAALHHRVALVNASPSAIATWHSAWTADPEKAHAPRYAATAARAPEQVAEPNRKGERARETTADQLRRMRQRYFLKTAPARCHNSALTASAPNACSF